MESRGGEVAHKVSEDKGKIVWVGVSAQGIVNVSPCPEFMGTEVASEGRSQSLHEKGCGRIPKDRRQNR